MPDDLLPKPAVLAELRGLDRRIAFALVYCAVVLAASEYWFLTAPAQRGALLAWWHPARPDLGASLIWVGSTILFFLVTPGLLVRFTHREPLSSIGWSTRGFFRHLPVYAGLYVLMLPLLWQVAQRPDFAAMYPFVDSARRDPAIFFRWELAYVLQFLALESFFRGYLLFTCARRFGLLAVPVMVVPYTMIHFHKPPLECFGAVFAGLLLGYLALRFRSFWGGVVLHAAVAVTMDFLAVRRNFGW